MKIGLLVTSIGDFGQKGFYNTQEIGLGKALDSFFDEVVIYKLVSSDNEYIEEPLEGCKNAHIRFIPSKKIGNNGILDIKLLDKDLDVLIYFTDTQLFVPKVYKWAIKNDIQFYPYIGVIESHSTNAVKRILINEFAKRNFEVYKKCHCFVKTPTVKCNLSKLGVNKITVTSIGLDRGLLYNGEIPSKALLKNKYGFDVNDKVVLFIGRLIDEKRPIEMIEIIKELHSIDPNYKLIMVGTGPLESIIKNKINDYELQNVVKRIDKLPNSQVWELYSFSDCFVNLNEQEIFGMAILEAMYYGCKVVAWNAPGPNFIIEDNVSGFIVSSMEEMINKIEDSKDMSSNSKIRVVNNFTWDIIAKNIKNIVESERN